MSRTTHLVGLGMVLAIALLSGSFLRAQGSSVAPAAPVPARIIRAKKVFISNAGEQRNPDGDLYFSGGPDRAYNQFYAAMKDWGRYELVSDPADADLVLEIHTADIRMGSYNELRLLLLDPRTHVTLWTFSQHAESAGRQKTRDASFDRAVSLISDDLKRLVGGPATATDVGKK